MVAINVLIKIAFFGVFIGMLYLVLDSFIGIVVNNFNIPFLDLFSYLGILQAIQVLISFSISSYIANQVISYFKSA
ncbi:MAG: hypothetical protein WCR78_04705 [Arcobacteraceae bacterium]